MKKLGFLAGVLLIAGAANAQFTNGELIVGLQSSGSADTSDASLSAINKTSGATGFTVALTGFRFNSSTVGGGIKGDIDGSMYLPGATSASNTVGRVGKVTLAGGFSQAVVGSAPRGVAADGAGGFFVTQGNGGAGLAQGSLTFDNSTSASLTNLNTNTSRLVTSWNGSAFVVRASNTGTTPPHGVLSGATGTTLVASAPTPATNGPIDASISWDGLTMYVTDERTTAGVGGILKFTRANTAANFDFQYLLSTDTDGAGALTTGARYLGVEYDQFGVATIYAATAESANNRLVKITDTGAGSIASALSTAGAGNLYKGVVVVPEPASMAAIGLGIIGLISRRRRKN